jgi:hypothetical protein
MSLTAICYGLNAYVLHHYHIEIYSLKRWCEEVELWEVSKSWRTTLVNGPYKREQGDPVQFICQGRTHRREQL